MSKRLIGDLTSAKGILDDTDGDDRLPLPPSPQGSSPGNVSPNPSPSHIGASTRTDLAQTAGKQPERDGHVAGRKGPSASPPMSPDSGVYKRQRLNGHPASLSHPPHSPSSIPRPSLASVENHLGATQSTSSASSSTSVPTRSSHPPHAPSSARSAPTRLNALHVSATAPTYTTPTGAVLTLQNAGFILSAYLQSYGLDPSHFRATSTYTTILARTHRQSKPKLGQPHQPPPDSLFHCTITLPKPCPISSFTSTGIGYRSKDLAKKHATMEIVKLLLESGEVTSELKPRPRNRQEKRERRQNGANLASRGVAGQTARSDPMDIQQHGVVHKGGLDRAGQPRNPGVINDPVLKGVSEYPHIPQARFWSTCPPFRPDDLYPTIMELVFGGNYNDRSKECRKLCLLTSRPLPLFGDKDEYNVDLTQLSVGMNKDTVEAAMKLTKGKRLKTLEEGKLDDIMRYTERLVRSQINKPAEGKLEDSRWLLVPLTPDYTVSTKVRRRDIAWTEIERASGPLCVPFSIDDVQKLEEEIVDAMSSPHVEFARRSYVKALRTDLSPYSIDPSDPKGEKTILAGFPTQVELSHPDQPIFQVDSVNGSRRGGFLWGLVNPKLVDRYIIPELVYRHCISASAFKTASALPMTLSAIDDLLVALDLSNDIFRGQLDMDIALTAITCPTSHQQNFAKSYQRLELLGDTLLKLLISVYLLYRVCDNPIDWDVLHQDRQVMVSNRTLQAHAIEAGVVPYIRGASQKAKEWIPLGWEAKEVGKDEDEKKVSQDEKMPRKGEDRQESKTAAMRVCTVNDNGASADGNKSPNEELEDAFEAVAQNESSSCPTSATSPSRDTVGPPKTEKEVYQSTEEIAGTDKQTRLQFPIAMTLTRDQNPDRLISPSWSLKRPRPDDPVFLRQRLGDKTVADVAESLVAAAYLSKGSDIDAAIAVMHILKMDLRDGFSKWEEVVWHTTERNAAKKEKYGGEMPITALGYTFELAQNGRDALALSHEPKIRDQFLQYKILGDAVLDYFMVEDLFHAYPNEGPGSLTVMRHSRHGDATLAAFSATSGLIDLVTGVDVEALNGALRFKKAVNAAKIDADMAKDEEDKLEFWAEINSPISSSTNELWAALFTVVCGSPQSMADVVNAVFGAILVDSNYNLARVREIYTASLSPFIDAYCVGPGARGRHPRTVWSEMIFKRGCRKWELRKDVGFTPDGKHLSSVWLHDEMIGRGEAETLSLSTRKACEEAVRRVKAENMLIRVCTCPKKKKQRDA